MSQSSPKPKKKSRMPTGMYTGGAILGIAILGMLLFIYTFIRSISLVQLGTGNVANYMTILIFIAIFLVGIPFYVGLRTLRRAGREARAQARRETQG